MSRKIYALLSLVLIASFVLAACGTPAATPTEAVTEATAEATTEVAATEAPAAELSGTLNVWSFTNEIRADTPVSPLTTP
jgi:hypothetical protein